MDASKMTGLGASQPQIPQNVQPQPKAEEQVQVPVDNFTYSDGVNHPLEAALLPSTDQVLGQAVAPFLMQGGARVKGTITRSDDPNYREYVNVEITSKSAMDEQTQQISGETFIRAAYGKKAPDATLISERGTLVTFQEGENALPGMTISGYVNKGGAPQEVNEELANVVGPGGAVTQGSVTKDIQVVQQSAAFLPGVEPDKVPENIDPSTLGSYQAGDIAGVKFERVVVPDGFPKYKIVGQFGNLEETGSIQFTEQNAVIDRTIGPFKIHEEVTPFKKE